MENFKLVVQWPSFGPYHYARLKAAHQVLLTSGVELIALETSARTDDYALMRRDYVNLPFQHHTLFVKQSAETPRLRDLLRRVGPWLTSIDPDCIATSGYFDWTARVLLYWAKRYRRKAILMSDSKLDDAPRRAIVERVKGIIVTRYDAYFCAGTLHRAYLQRLGATRDRISLGYDTVDNNYFAQKSHDMPADNTLPGINGNRPFFLASARLLRRKNIHTLIAAYALYRASADTDHAWRLVILGDGPEREALERQVATSAVPDVTFAGFRQIEALPHYYGAAGAFVHPAYQEQWGLVVNEAMAAGLPVLVSERCGCAPDLVVDGITGLRFNPDDTDQLARQLAAIADGRIDRYAMGKAAQRHMTNWGLERFSAGLQQAVAHALDLPQTKRRPNAPVAE